MAAEVVLTEEAKESLKAIKNPVILVRMDKLISRLRNWPQVSGAKALTGNLAGKYRMRTGDYRIQFRVETTQVQAEDEERPGKPAKNRKPLQRHRVIIEKAGHRDRFYDD